MSTYAHAPMRDGRQVEEVGVGPTLSDGGGGLNGVGGSLHSANLKTLPPFFQWVPSL